MKTEFHFSEFTPDDDLKFEANQVLDHVLDLAPYGSIAVAMLKREDDSYRCSIDVYSKHGPFIANTVQATPLLALPHVQDILCKKLRDWRQRRFTHARAATIQGRAS